MMLKSIALVHKWYEVAGRFEKSRLELAKAQKSFDYFQSQFENVGKSLNKAQEAFETAQKHLKTYRGRVSVLSGQEQLELDATTVRVGESQGEESSSEDPLPLSDKASA
jgi:DNA anti-recombination protein RmuC